jgi:purine-nucleoside phosphorylase
MASGMGMPSIGIYSFELFNFFHVGSIIRIGSAGAIHPDLKLYDIVIAQGACTDSAYFKNFNIRGSYAPISDFGLLRKAVDECENRGLSYKVGNILSSDVFYSEGGIKESLEWRKFGVLAVEMESAALYMNAARAGKKALTICTISDLMEDGKAATAEERQNAFHEMMKVALTIAE